MHIVRKWPLSNNKAFTNILDPCIWNTYSHVLWDSCLTLFFQFSLVSSDYNNRRGKTKSGVDRKQTKEADGKSKEAAAKKAENRSLAYRLAQRQKVPNSSSSRSGTECTSRSAARSKKQTTLEMFSTTKPADKAKKADSDDDFIRQFSDEEDGPPPLKKTARSTAPEV